MEINNFLLKNRITPDCHFIASLIHYINLHLPISAPLELLLVSGFMLAQGMGTMQFDRPLSFDLGSFQLSCICYQEQ